MYRHVQQDRRRTYKRNNDVRSPNLCGRAKAINITYTECVFVAFFIQYVERMRRVLLSPLGLYVSTIFLHFPSLNVRVTRKQRLNTKRVLSEIFLMLTRLRPDIIK